MRCCAFPNLPLLLGLGGGGDDSKDDDDDELGASSSSASTSGIGPYASAVVACELAEALASMLHHQLHEVKSKSVIPSESETVIREQSNLYKEKIKCAKMLGQVESASSRLFKVKSEALALGCRLRLRLLTSATLLTGALNLSKVRDLEPHIEFETSRVKVRLVGLAIDSLNLLKMKSPYQSSPSSSHYWYSFGGDDGGHGSDTPEHRAGELLHVCVALLSELLPREVDSADTSYAREYARDYATALRVLRGVPSLLSHLEEASAYAASHLGSGHGGVQDAMAFSERLMTFLFSAASCADIGTVLAEDNIHRAFCENSLLKKGRDMWSTLRQAAQQDSRGSATHDRGYDSVYMYAREADRLAQADPVHEVWLLSLRTVSALLRMDAGANSNSSFDPDSYRALIDRTVDYLCTYCDLMLSGLQSPRVKGEKKYTLRTLREMTFISELLSEVAKGPAAGRFRCAAPVQSSELFIIAMDESKDVCSFLGSLTLARFHLSKRRRSCKDSWFRAGLPGGQSTASTSNTQNMREVRAEHDAHKAFRHCWHGAMYKTEEEDPTRRERKKTHADSITTLVSVSSRQDSANPSDSETIEATIETTFMKRVEDRAAMFLSYAVAYILRCHPGYNSFVNFTPDEALSINLYSDDVIHVGSVVAIYEQAVVLGSKDGGGSVNYGEVVSKSPDNRSKFAVMYFKDGSVESLLGSSRIAGVQDDSARQNILVPRTVSWDTQVGVQEFPFSFGHLVYVIQWVGTFFLDKDWTRVDEDWKRSGSMFLEEDAKLLAERVMSFLAFEVTLLEEKIPTQEDADLLDVWSADERSVDWTRDFMDSFTKSSDVRTSGTAAAAAARMQLIDETTRKQLNAQLKSELQALCEHVFDAFHVSEPPERPGVASVPKPAVERTHLRKNLDSEVYAVAQGALRHVFKAAEKFKDLRRKSRTQSVLSGTPLQKQTPGKKFPSAQKKI